MNSETLERVCINGICHCDWRLTLQDCVEEKAMTIIHGINVGISGITVILGTALLCHRLFIKGHQLVDINLSKGCFRPKPIDCMLLFIIFYNLLRLISSIILITDIAKDLISRSFMFEFPWQFGYGAFALYLVGIAQTLADSHKVIANSWLPSPRLVDLFGGTLFLAPFILNNSMSLAAGIMAERDLRLAVIFTRLLYVFWFIHCTSLGIAVLISGLRLIHILEEHLKKIRSTGGPRYTSIKTGIFKIRVVMGIIVVCVLMFATFLLLYGILRDLIIVNKAGSIVLGAIWNFLGAVSTLGVVIAILINPKIDENANLGLKSSSAEKSNPTPYSNFASQEYSTTASALSSNGQGGVNSATFDELRMQQMQYQQVFQKHNNHVIPRIDSNMDRKNNIYIPDNVPSLAMPDIETQKYEYSFEYNSRSKNTNNHITDDDQIVDDGETSQLDLVEHASRNQMGTY
ncbi:hypothetical protein RMATCC62417_02015 [Rhizopus microsporus]|nr:hypothetical protein RMATCC62417_02015 [Rhizopus microsporus]CEJ01957.1 hypothetical protein RMCBS344292_15977 [Rhizopus microsporus]